MDYHIKDIGLAEKGQLRIEWAGHSMQVLAKIRERFGREKPLVGAKIAACLHVTTETANLMMTLLAGGAEVALCASNPLSTQDDAAAAIVRNLGAPVFAIKGEDRDTYYRHINSALDTDPNIVMDDGADLISTIHLQRDKLAKEIVGATEETTTGVVRLRSLAQKGLLKFPIIAVNDANTKYLFDNRYGTGQSTIDGIIRATNRLMAGAVFVVCGYGWCGRGVAMRAKGLGANVIVTEVNPLRALEAVMDGYRVMPMREAAKIGQFFVTLTGNVNVIGAEHFSLMKDGAILANSGHFNVEIDIEALRRLAKSSRKVKESVEEFIFADSRRIYLLGEGRLVNLSAAEGHPSSVMDMSFSNQALCVEYIYKYGHELKDDVYKVPDEIDETIARLKLHGLCVEIDELTVEQKKYLESWEMGT